MEYTVESLIEKLKEFDMSLPVLGYDHYFMINLFHLEIEKKMKTDKDVISDSNKSEEMPEEFISIM